MRVLGWMAVAWAGAAALTWLLVQGIGEGVVR
jgi:hypothetical protein